MRRHSRHDLQVDIHMCPPSEIVSIFEPPSTEFQTIVFPSEPSGYTLDASSFYKCVFSASEDNGFLFFSEDIEPFDHKSLYIRRSYIEIASQIESAKKSVVTGSPGIGKTMFLYYLLWRLVKAGKRVLFVYRGYKIYYNGRGGVVSLESIPHAGMDEFWNFELWCIHDSPSMNPESLRNVPYDACRFVLSTTPWDELVSDLRKPPIPRVFFMPVWKQSELGKIAHLYPRALNWRDRFKVLGGIPRYVLVKTADKPAALIRSLCSSHRLEDMLRISPNISATHNPHNSIFLLAHLTSRPPYTKATLKFASIPAIQMTFEHNADQIREHRDTLLRYSRKGNRLADTLCARTQVLNPL